MADIVVLPKQLAELIAAGEVVERPASVIKELTENAIDASADQITVEIQRGGILYMRVTDNGSGIRHDQVKTAFLRHATSKIKTEKDLFAIATLGFRGEALASVSAVARVEMLTKTVEEPFGTRYVIEGGEEQEFSESGCPDGTTIIVRDLFYNTPARMKFLKKDATETAAVAAVVDGIALSHPEIAVRFIKDGKLMMNTPGDGKLESAVYAVLGREFSSTLIPADATTNGIRVSGLICKPIHCRPTRGGQYFFLNHRLIRSGAAAKALDEAYKHSVMVGKFPACVLNIELPFDRVDVNVHPAKTEVRFSDERAVFEAVYYAAKNALQHGDARPEFKLNPNKPKPNDKKPEPFQHMTTETFKKVFGEKTEPTPAEIVYGNRPVRSAFSDHTKPAFTGIDVTHLVPENQSPKMPAAPVKQDEVPLEPVADQGKSETLPILDKIETPFRYIGEAFRTYLIAEYDGSLYLIDKHAAHERMIYEKLKKEKTPETQLLLSPVSVTLSREEFRAVLDHNELLTDAGFEVEEFGTSSVLVRAVPATLADSDVTFTVCEIAGNLLTKGKAENEKLDDLYHSVACRSAVKGGNIQSPAELEKLALDVLSNDDIRYCPHGRPIAFEIKKSQIEKQFGRLN